MSQTPPPAETDLYPAVRDYLLDQGYHVQGRSDREGGCQGGNSSSSR